MRQKLFFSIIFIILCSNIGAQTYTLEDKWVDCGNNVQLLVLIIHLEFLFSGRVLPKMVKLMDMELQ